MSETLISVRDLTVEFATSRGTARVLRGISADLPRGRIVGVVGESGSGKSTLAMAMLGLLPPNVTKRAGAILYQGRDLLSLQPAALRALRGTKLAMIFQDPMTALNPVFTVGTQLVDMQRAHDRAAPRKALMDRAAAMLARVGIPEVTRRLAQYPHEFSGGMRQRVMIAAALLTEPDLLIADEPTTALDPTIETQIVRLIAELHQGFGGTIMLISHSLGLISELCDEVIVLYAGTVVEMGPAATLFRAPRHPYTRALIECEVPAAAKRGDRLASIPGDVPDVTRMHDGCVFADRCPLASSECRAAPPALRAFPGGQYAACIKA